MKSKLSKVFGFILVLVLFNIALRLTITPLRGSNSYGKDIFGFVYHMHTSCGWVGSCSTSYKFIGEHSIYFSEIKDKDCKLGKGIRFHLGSRALPFKTYKREGTSEFFITDDGLYYSCSFQEIPLDPETATVITSHCAIDSKMTYCYGSPKSDLDPKTTVFVNNYFAINDGKVWFIPQRKVVEGVDSNSFEYISMSKTAVHTIKDKNGTYYYESWKSTPLTKIQ